MIIIRLTKITLQQWFGAVAPGEAPDFILSTSNFKKQFAKCNPTANMHRSKHTPRVVHPGTALLATFSLEKENEAKLPETHHHNNRAYYVLLLFLSKLVFMLTQASMLAGWL